MKIIRATLWSVALKSHVAYHMANGKSCDSVTTSILRLDTDAGISGWGEVCPIPHYLPAFAGGVAPVLEELAPVLIGADPCGPEALMDTLERYLLGHPYAKSAIDIALWDITAQCARLPLYALLGGRVQERLPLYHSISCLSPDAMARIAKEAEKEGMTQFQVKLGADGDYQQDAERLRAVRKTVPESALVYGDWNCGASRLNATRVALAVRNLDIMIEQPCATLEDCAAVRQASNLPMKIDENAYDTASLLRAYQLGCMDAVAIKLSKFGGLSASRRARDLCLHLGPKMCVEDTWGSDITTAALLHLAVSTPARNLLNTCDLSGYVSPRLDAQAPVRERGFIKPPEGIGLGVKPDASSLGAAVTTID